MPNGQYALKIDLLKCVGCGACALACKAGNNTPWRFRGQTFNWADFLVDTVGEFPNTTWRVTPVNCNHCISPACVAACPVAPDALGRKAMYKDTTTGIVMHDDDRCVGCRRCQDACPYSTRDVRRTVTQGSTFGKPQFSVISYNQYSPHAYWDSTYAVIPDCTATPAEVKAKAGTAPPYRTKWEPGSYSVYDVRRSKIVEKCYLCFHRILDTDLPENERKPNCVLRCPAGARQLLLPDDPVPEGAKVLKPGSRIYAEFIDPPASGLRPQVYYVNTDSYTKRLS